MQELRKVGFIGCMRQNYMRNIHWTAVVVGALLLLAGCSKGGEYDIMAPGENYYYSDPQKGTSNDLAIGTVRSRDGVRYIRLDEKNCSQVMNPGEIAGIADGTRVFLQYRSVVAPSIAGFCTDAILVEWASPLDMGAQSLLSFEEAHTADSFAATDPVDIVKDWITSLEDDFLTLHYTIASGDKKHAFVLYRSWMGPADFYLVHDAGGDAGKTQKDGMVCFPMWMENLFPDLEEGETASFTLHYLGLDHTLKTLTFEYRSPK